MPIKLEAQYLNIFQYQKSPMKKPRGKIFGFFNTKIQLVKHTLERYMTLHGRGHGHQP